MNISWLSPRVCKYLVCMLLLSTIYCHLGSATKTSTAFCCFHQRPQCKGCCDANSNIVLSAGTRDIFRFCRSNGDKITPWNRAAPLATSQHRLLLLSSPSWFLKNVFFTPGACKMLFKGKEKYRVTCGIHLSSHPESFHIFF